MKYLYFLLGTFVLSCLISCKGNEQIAASEEKIPSQIDFNFHIRPILSDRCYKCHGPDEKVREANLRLDIQAGAFAMLDSIEQSYAIVPGDLGKSRLFQRVNIKNPDLIMPPPESNLELSEREIELLKRWIEQGAEWKEHWAFIPPQKSPLPDVNKQDWPKNEIDHFLLARMEDKGLAPAGRASKEKLIRRLSFDLRGIPPSLEEIDAFVQDESPNAYEKWIDTFLKSENYGERMAMDWLDLARYADSHGYQDDIERSMWPWRDWVIKAFNENLPYNQFVTWQLAGDLLPDPTYEQKLATGFNRNHKITQEVGVVDEEYRVEYVLDRVHTVSTSFMGLTIACAQCHDHKFDPISQKEFYSLFSFFNQVPEAGRVEYNVEVAEPSLPLPDETVEKYKAYMDELLSSQQEEITEYAKQQSPTSDKWLTSFSSQPDKEHGNMIEGMVAHFSLDYQEDSLFAEELSGELVARGKNGPVSVKGRFSGALEFSSKNSLDLGKLSKVDFRKPFSFSCWIYSINGGISGPILAPMYGGDKPPRGLELNVSGEKAFIVKMRDRSGKQVLSLRSREEVPSDKWVNILLTSDGSGRASGVQMYMDGHEMEMIIAEDKLRSTIGPHRSVRIAGRQKGRTLVSGQLDELMFFNRVLSQKEAKQLADFNPVQQLIQKGSLTENGEKRLFHNYLLNADEEYLALVDRLREYKIRAVRTEAIVLKPTMIMADMDTIRPTYVLDRGSYESPTERVYPATPSHILDFPEEFPQNRLGLAKWLFLPQHPLTARVAVNRYWQMIFGKGIVATPEDFGSQGDLPTHPELLDWLALDFQASGWDIKRLVKLLLMSAAYQQSVSTDKQKQEIDPANVYLARGPAVRLPAEMIRDHALAVSGLLSHQVGGPSVKPYNPEGLWLEAASGNQSLRKYIQDHGQDLYRKSMYTFWKRTVPPPSMSIFDAPPREECTVRRHSTSTPMQALVMLNDPQFVEASRLIAERMLREGGEDAETRITFAFRLATSRKPIKQELQLLGKMLEEQKAGFEEDPQKASAYLAIGEFPDTEEFEAPELAAYALVANAILNLTESIQKG